MTTIKTVEISEDSFFTIMDKIGAEMEVSDVGRTHISKMYYRLGRYNEKRPVGFSYYAGGKTSYTIAKYLVETYQ